LAKDIGLLILYICDMRGIRRLSCNFPPSCLKLFYFDILAVNLSETLVSLPKYLSSHAGDITFVRIT